jgi:hypothetical protein
MDASESAESELVVVPPPPSFDATVEAETQETQTWLNEQLQSSIFYAEPVSHVMFQVMCVDQSGILTRADTFVAKLTEPNIIGRMDIARIIKRSRFSADCSRLEYRLNSLFVYNAHIKLSQIADYIRNPAAFNFVTVLTSISSFKFKPTLACFHSLNSVHVVLSAVSAPITIPIPIPIPTTNAEARTTRTVHITRGAIFGRYSRKK